MPYLGPYGPVLIGALIVGVVGVALSVIENKHRNRAK